MKMYTVQEVAEKLGKDPSWIKKLIKAGKIEAFRHGKRAFVITDYSKAIGLERGNPNWGRKKPSK